MHISRLATAVLGFWLAGSLFLYLIPTHNFRAADDVLSATAEPVQEASAKLAPGQARQLLRFMASEQNRWLFHRWEVIQLLIGVLLTLLLLLSTTGRKSVVLFSLAMTILVALMHWILTPEITRLGRLIDFLPADAPSAERTQFWNYHNAYSALEMAKLGLGLVTLWMMVTRSRKRRHGRDSDDE